MTSKYEPGTVAMVTALNHPTPYRAFFDGRTWREHRSAAFCVDTPATIRPLVVLDPDDRVVVDFLRAHKEDGCAYGGAALARMISEQSQPPRIPEPGLWGVVEAGHEHLEGGTRERSEFVRVSLTGNWQWVDRNAEADWCTWDQLTNPTLIRPGIEDGAS